MRRKKSGMKPFHTKGPQRDSLNESRLLQPIGEAFLYQSPHELQAYTCRPVDRAWDHGHEHD